MFPKFDYFHVPRIVFGRGQFVRLGELAASFGESVLLIQNGPGELAENARGLLVGANCRVAAVRQSGEPTVAQVDAALATASEQQCEVVVGLGGGSAIDAAKAVAGLLTNGGSALDYMEVVGKGRKITKMAAPWIAVPTTAGTGAEVTRNAVVGSPEHRFKASIRGEQLLARIALVDPELGISTPKAVTASSGMDALCQCIEAYTSLGAQPITDTLALEGVRLCANSLARAVENGNDGDAREEMALAAMLSGIALTNAGLGAVHGFAAPLGAHFPAPHGTICAALLPHVVAANVSALTSENPASPILSRYAEVGRIFGADVACTDARGIATAIDQTNALISKLRIPPLRDYGLTSDDIPGLVALARKASSMRFNPVVLDDQALSHILALSI